MAKSGIVKNEKMGVLVTVAMIGIILLFFVPVSGPFLDILQEIGRASCRERV